MAPFLQPGGTAPSRSVVPARGSTFDMLDSTAVWLLLTRWPFWAGSMMHRAGLRALARDEHEAADTLFERAAARYRQELCVEALARLRVHQLIARARASTSAPMQVDQVVEVEQRLARLERIESLEPPFSMVGAHELMGAWAHGRQEPDTAPLHSAAA